MCRGLIYRAIYCYFESIDSNNIADVIFEKLLARLNYGVAREYVKVNDRYGVLSCFYTSDVTLDNINFILRSLYIAVLHVEVIEDMDYYIIALVNYIMTSNEYKNKLDNIL